MADFDIYDGVQKWNFKMASLLLSLHFIFRIFLYCIIVMCTSYEFYVFKKYFNVFDTHEFYVNFVYHNGMKWNELNWNRKKSMYNETNVKRVHINTHTHTT